MNKQNKERVVILFWFIFNGSSLPSYFQYLSVAESGEALIISHSLFHYTKIWTSLASIFIQSFNTSQWYEKKTNDIVIIKNQRLRDLFWFGSQIMLLVTLWLCQLICQSTAVSTCNFLMSDCLFAVLSAQEPEARLINIRVNLTSTFKIRENECVINENECGNIYKYIYHIHKWYVDKCSCSKGKYPQTGWIDVTEDNSYEHPKKT